ncbi:KRAB-A domain-containing protein 2 [Trichonephila clavipes]|nr:KRAB-A domain-containing protein 2 [Trichonephila clavipes]
MFLSVYFSVGHGGRDRMIRELNRRYKNITQNDIKLFLSAFEPCQQKRIMGKKGIAVKPMVFPHLNSKCQVDIIDFQSQTNGNYKFILVYQDHLKKFGILRTVIEQQDSAFTVARCLHKDGLFTRRPKRCISLITARRRHHLQWCLNRKTRCLINGVPFCLKESFQSGQRFSGTADMERDWKTVLFYSHHEKRPLE